MRPLRLLAATLASVAALATPAPAAEWHESYREGMKALAQGK